MVQREHIEEIPMKETVIDIVEDYLSKNTSGEVPPEQELIKRFKQAGIPDESMHDILLELEDDAAKDETERIRSGSSKTKIIFGLGIAIPLMVLSILIALGKFFSGSAIVIWYGGIAYGLLMAQRGYADIKKAKLRKQRRAIKWSVWDR